MRYTIGVSMWKKTSPDDVCEGIYGFGPFMIPYIHTPNKDTKLKDSFFPVFSNAADAEHYARTLSRAYRCDDTCLYGKRARSSYIRRFYPLKVDTKEFPYQIKIDDNTDIEFLYQMDSRDIDDRDIYVHYYVSNLPGEDQETRIPLLCFEMYRK